MEIERKFLIPTLPENLSSCPSMELEQGYLCTSPVVRVRREGDDYVLTYKSDGLMAHEEYNLPLDEASYRHLLKKADGRIITKTRYRIPCTPNRECIPYLDGADLTIELDVFHGDLAPLQMAEVEFPTEKAALAFRPPAWFGRDVTCDPAYHNSNMSKG